MQWDNFILYCSKWCIDVLRIPDIYYGVVNEICIGGGTIITCRLMASRCPLKSDILVRVGAGKPFSY